MSWAGCCTTWLRCCSWPSRRSLAAPLAPLELPARSLDAGGAIDLGADGAALACRASAVNFALRTQAEQQALVAAFARALHALAGPVQFLVRAERVDLREAVERLEAQAGGLPHPALEAAAREHARFLAGLAQRRDVLRQELILTLLRNRASIGEVFFRCTWHPAPTRPWSTATCSAPPRR